MTAVCISSTRGVDVAKMANYTIATSGPTSNFDFELRYNLLDQNSVALKERDLILFLEAVIVAIEAGTTIGFSTAVNGSNYAGPQI